MELTEWNFTKRNPNALAIQAAAKENLASTSPQPWRDFAETHGITRQACYAIVKRLRQSGAAEPYKVKTYAPTSIFPKKFTKPTPSRRRPGAPDPEIPPDSQTSSKDAQDPVVRRRLLAEMAILSTDSNRLGAIGKLEELDRMSGARIGPPPPETEEQYDARLGMMLYAAGPERVQRAINWAAKHKEQENALPPEIPVGSDGHEDDAPTGYGPGPSAIEAI